MIPYKRYGVKQFKKRNFSLAATYFSLALEKKPNDQELLTYLALTNLALIREDEAISLFEFYRVSRNSEELKGNEKQIQSLIESLEIRHEFFNSAMQAQELEDILLHEKGISYADFLELVERRGSFKLAFEDIMFSTRVLISKKEDFLHFLHLLIDNGFKQMALSYLENATSLFPFESSLQEIATKAQKADK